MVVHLGSGLDVSRGGPVMGGRCKWGDGGWHGGCGFVEEKKD